MQLDRRVAIAKKWQNWEKDYTVLDAIKKDTDHPDQYLDTGIIGNGLTSYSLIFKPISLQNTRYIGFSKSGSPVYLNYLSSTNDGYYSWFYAQGGGVHGYCCIEEQVGKNTITALDASLIGNIQQDKINVRLDLDFGTPGESFSKELNPIKSYLGTEYTTGTVTLYQKESGTNFELYEVTIYQNFYKNGSFTPVPVFHGIPVRRIVDKRVGLYDTINHRFCDNASADGSNFIGIPESQQ